MAIPFLALLVAGAAGSRSAPVKEVRKGQHGDVTAAGTWSACTDEGKTEPLEHLVQLKATYANHKLTVPPNLFNAKAFYDAAFATCFIKDRDHDDKLGDNASTSDLGTINGARVEIAPAAHVHKVTIKNEKVDYNTGFFIAEIRTVTGSRDVKDLDGHRFTIGEGESTLLFYGRDGEGSFYLAEFDLQRFPSTKPSGTNAIHVLGVGTLEDGLQPSDHTAQFARFSAPKHHSHRASFVYPDGTWIGCAPGCCVASGMVLLTTPRTRSHLNRRRK